MMPLTDEQQKLVEATVRACIEQRVDDRVDRAIRPVRIAASVLGVASLATLIGVLIYVLALLPEFAGSRAVDRITSGTNYVGSTLEQLNKQLVDAAIKLETAKSGAVKATEEFEKARTELEASRTQLVEAKKTANDTITATRQAIEALEATDVKEAGDKITWLNRALKEGDPAARLVQIEGRLSELDTLSKRLNVAWQSLDIAKGFEPDEGFGTPEIATGDNGAVWLRGFLRVPSGTVAKDEVVVMLPPEARPNKELMFLVVAHGGSLRLDVYPDGAVRVTEATRPCGWIALDGIAFFTRRPQ